MVGPAGHRTRVLLVGAGRRARETLIPAIHCASPWIDLVGICARSERELELLGGQFRSTTRRLADVDMGSVDAIVVSVATPNVPGLLGELTDRGASGRILMLDTPVLEPRDLGSARKFGQFRQVLASEDNFALPPFVLARQLVTEGAIGRLRKIYLFHSGYRHHALAALKQLTGAQRPKRLVIERSSSWSLEVHVSFPGGIRATVFEPRHYDVARTMIVGDKGFIVDYPLKHARSVRIGYRTTEGRFLGLTTNDEPVPPTELDNALAAGLEGAPLDDPSLMNQLKIRGFMELLSGLSDPSSRFRYQALDAIDDNLSMLFGERLPFVPAGRGALLRTTARVAARFVPSGGHET